MADQALTISGAGTGAVAPLAYTIPGTGEIILKMAFARMDGTATVGSWVPCLRFKTPNGGLMAECLGNTVAAGASADVTWFPDVGGGGGGSGGGNTRILPIPLTTADTSGNAYPIFTWNQGFTISRQIVPGFQATVDGEWSGSITVPADYKSGATIVLHWTVNSTTGNVRWLVGSFVIADTASFDPSYTNETGQTVAAPATADHRVTTSFLLSTVPIAGTTLNIQIERNGTNVADTCTADAMLMGVEFSYVAAY